MILPHRVGPELSARIRLARRWDGSQVNHGIDTGVGHVGRNEGLEHTAHVLQVNLHQSVCTSKPALAILANPWRTASVYRDDFPSFVCEVVDCRATKLSTTTSDDDTRLALASRELAESELVGEGRCWVRHVGCESLVVYEDSKGRGEDRRQSDETKYILPHELFHKSLSSLRPTKLLSGQSYIMGRVQAAVSGVVRRLVGSCLCEQEGKQKADGGL